MSWNKTKKITHIHQPIIEREIIESFSEYNVKYQRIF